MTAVQEVAAGVARFADTCNVYVVRTGRDAVLVDFGSGAVLDALPELGVDRVTDVLVTHHHRDQVQGLDRAVRAGIRVWVPPVEVELFTRADEWWQARTLDDDYDLREHRFSLLDSVAVAGVVSEYLTRSYGGVELYTLPTPGHTIGSVTYILERDGRRLAFTGDLLYGPGRLWSLAATQWTYGGVEGQAATILSCGLLARRAPDLLLPAHGEPMEDASAALTCTRTDLTRLLELRREGPPWDLDGWIEQPWVEIAPRLLRNRTSVATSYALLSRDGAALLLDWGYDFWTGMPLGSGERATNRPLLASLDALRASYDVERIEAAVTTHYHDDHVAGLNLLREVEGTKVWSPENVAPILENPHRYDLPCLWFDPIAVDRVLPLREPVHWHEYELICHPLPGHTLYAAAIAFELDGMRVLATGDQQAGGPGERATLNYQYRNRFRIDDYVQSAELYRALRPDLLITGHWLPVEVDDTYLDRLLADGQELAALHRELLPLDEVDFGAGGFGARIEPYRSTVPRGTPLELDVWVRNPFDRAGLATVTLAVPESWAHPAAQEVELPTRGEATLRFRVDTAGADPVRRARVAADLTVGERRFGQQAEAFVSIE